MKDSKYPTRLFKQYGFSDDSDLGKELDEELIKELEKISNTNLTLADIGRDLGSPWRSVNRFNTPLFVIETIIDILSDQQFESALDPYANNGLLISSLVDTGIIKRGVGISDDLKEIVIAKKLSESLVIDWVHEDPFEWLEKTTNEFDLIVSNPRWGLRSAVFRNLMLLEGVKDSDDALMIIQSCHRLKPDGICIFIVPKSFVSHSRPDSVYSNLSKFGLTLDTFLALPPQAFAPTTSVAGGIAIIRKSNPMSVFTGLVQTDPKQRKQLIENLHKRQASRDIIFGTLVDPRDFRGFEAVENQDRINRISKRFGYPANPLKDIIFELNLAKNKEPHFQERENSVYLPLIGTSPAVTGISDLNIKPHNYIQLIINPSKADAEYIAGLFNSPFGRTLRDQGLSGAFIPKLTKTTMDYLTIFLPPLSDQKNLFEADRHIRTIEADIRSLHDQLWSEPRTLNKIKPKLEHMTREESFKEWVDRLPFPIASILWTYNAAGNDNEKRYQHLLNLFEAVTAFMATILLSALLQDAECKDKVITDLITDLKKRNQPIERPSFGTWVNTYSKLAKVLRKMAETNDENTKERVFQYLKTHDMDVVRLVTSSDLVFLLMQINAKRNRWKGHSGIVGEKDARERHDSLKEDILKMRKIFGSSWDRYLLVYPTHEMPKRGLYHQTVEKVTGSSTPFEKIILELNAGLDEGSLHIIGEGERNALRLLPFIKLRSSLESAKNACYFLNKKEPGGFRFVSYHQDVESSIEEKFPDVDAALQELNRMKNDGNLTTTDRD